MGSEAKPPAFGSGGAGQGPDPRNPTCSVDVSTDPKNCGFCGHDCRGSSCVAGYCEPEVFATVPDSVTDISELEIIDGVLYALLDDGTDSLFRASPSGPMEKRMDRVVTPPSGKSWMDLGYVWTVRTGKIMSTHECDAVRQGREEWCLAIDRVPVTGGASRRVITRAYNYMPDLNCITALSPDRLIYLTGGWLFELTSAGVGRSAAVSYSLGCDTRRDGSTLWMSISSEILRLNVDTFEVTPVTRTDEFASFLSSRGDEITYATLSSSAWLWRLPKSSGVPTALVEVPPWSTWPPPWPIAVAVPRTANTTERAALQTKLADQDVIAVYDTRTGAGGVVAQGNAPLALSNEHVYFVHRGKILRTRF